MLLSQVLLHMTPDMLENISLNTLSGFLRLIPHLRNQIQFAPGERSRGDNLPENILEFLAHALNIDNTQIHSLWRSIGSYAINSCPAALSERDLGSFTQYGELYAIGKLISSNSVASIDISQAIRMCIHLQQYALHPSAVDSGLETTRATKLYYSRYAKGRFRCSTHRSIVEVCMIHHNIYITLDHPVLHCL